MKRDETVFPVGLIVGFVLVFSIWISYETGFDKAIKLCSSHPVESSVLYNKGGNQ